MVGGWEALSLVGKAPSDLYNSHDTAMGRRQCLPLSIAQTYLQLLLRQWGAGNVYLLVLSS